MISTPRDQKNFKAIENLIQIEIPINDNYSLDKILGDGKKANKKELKNNSQGKTNVKGNKPTYGLSKSDVTNHNKPANSSEDDNEFELPNFITKSFVERLTL